MTVQVGDRLRCLKPDGHFMARGGVYEVREVWDLQGVPAVGLNVVPGQLWGLWRFEPEEQPDHPRS